MTNPDPDFQPAWRCPKCGKAYELGEAAWVAFDPSSEALCPDDACGAALEVA